VVGAHKEAPNVLKANISCMIPYSPFLEFGLIHNFPCFNGQWTHSIRVSLGERAGPPYPSLSSPNLIV